jgi:hypothetical protein
MPSASESSEIFSLPKRPKLLTSKKKQSVEEVYIPCYIHLVAISSSDENECT